MKKLILLAALLTCGIVNPVQAWYLGTSPNAAPINRKIVRVFHETNNGAQTFAAFVLSQEGGTYVSNEAIIVHDLNTAAGQAIYQSLLKIYEGGERITYLSNNSRKEDYGSWNGVSTFYRVYAGDYFGYWKQKN
jgi:hypothetical protein